MGKVKNLLGQKFGRLTVISGAENAKDGHIQYNCKCDCGNECVVAGSQLTGCRSHSCGCLRRDTPLIHGMKNTPIYRNWCDIKRLCFNSQRKCYHNYGGRGIKIAPEWENDFSAFYKYISKLEHFGRPGYSLDRIDNDGNYEPGNVRWATPKKQILRRRQRGTPLSPCTQQSLSK